MYIHKKDPVTGINRTVVIDITQEQIDSWIDGELIQFAMPNLTPDEREFVKLGIYDSSLDSQLYYWQDSHITQKDGLYIAWDETGADTVGSFKSLEEARDALTHYSNQLNGNLDYSSALDNKIK